MLARKNDNGQAALWSIFKNQTTCPTALSGHCERFVVSSTGHWTQGFNDLSLLLA